MSEPRHPARKTEQRLERYYSSRPRPGFEHELEQRLLEAAQTMNTTHSARSANRYGRVFQVSLSVAGLALLLVVMILALQTRPQPAANPPAATSSVAAVLPAPASPAPSLQATLTATPLPAALDVPRRLLPGLCPPAGPTATNESPEIAAPLIQRGAQGELGGGEATTGDFTFNLRVVCDPAFTRNSPDFSMSTEFEGLGIATSWSYQGVPVPGETVESAGFQPYVSITGSIGPSLDSGSGSQNLQGMQFPVGLFLSFPPGDLTFSYVFKLQAPDGRQAGAELRFTLHPEAEGYRPVNMAVRPLDAAMLAAEATPAPTDYTLLPTLAPAQVDPVLGELSQALDAWQNQMLAGAGWLHVSQLVETRESGGYLANGAEIPATYRQDDWYLLDEDGLVLRSINRQVDLQGNPVQVSVISDGEYRNLTLGDSGASGPPWRPDFSFNLYNDAAQAVRQGVAIVSRPDEVNGIPAKQFVLDYSGYSTSLMLDATSGRPLVYERRSSPGPGQPAEMEQRITMESMERRDAPPADLLALFDATPAPYHPAPPVGTPAPESFDPSASYVGMKMIGGDSIHQPTFFQGDLYALPEPPQADGIINSSSELKNGYLLGRVDFGGIPGGWCDRSADGSRLAFNWLEPGDETHAANRLRWFELRAPGLVYMPDPDLTLNSPVSFAPTGYTLAVFACKGQACGLYLLEAEGDSTPARLLTRDLANFSTPIWKPDGTQIASVMLDDQGALALTIVDAQTGQIVYHGPRLGSPFESWGVPLSDSLGGFDRCVAP